MSRHAQPLCSQQLRGTPGVTRTVTGRVTCVFHAPVTATNDLCHWGTVFLHQEGREKYGPVGLALRKLQPYVTLRDLPRVPCPIEAFESVTVKAPPRLIEEFQVFSNGHDILVALPLPAHLEVAEDLARDVGFEVCLYEGAKTLLGLLKIGVLRSD